MLLPVSLGQQRGRSRTGPSAQGRTRLHSGSAQGRVPTWTEEPTLPAVTAGSSFTSFRPQTQGSPLLSSKGDSRPLEQVCTQGSLQRRWALAEGTAHPLGHILQVRRHSQVRPMLKERGPYQAVTTQSTITGPSEGPCTTKTVRAFTITQC